MYIYIHTYVQIDMYLKPSQILGPSFDSCRSWEMVPGTSCLPAMVCGSF